VDLVEKAAGLAAMVSWETAVPSVSRMQTERVLACRSTPQ
jgi:hypothetical protein